MKPGRVVKSIFLIFMIVLGKEQACSGQLPWAALLLWGEVDVLGSGLSKPVGWVRMHFQCVESRISCPLRSLPNLKFCSPGHSAFCFNFRVNSIWFRDEFMIIIWVV